LFEVDFTNIVDGGESFPLHMYFGVAPEGCLYSKNNQQKAARILSLPNPFLFLLLFLIFLWLTP
jgi:hypothetical protein